MNSLGDLLRRLEEAMQKLELAFVTAISKRYQPLLSETQLLIREVAVRAPAGDQQRDRSSGEEEVISLGHLRKTPDCSTALEAEPLAQPRKKRKVALAQRLNGKTIVLPPRLAYTIKETAHVLGGVCPKSVRRLIARNLLRPSRGLRCPLIPIWEIVRYLVVTSGHSAKEHERFIQLFHESLLMVHGKCSGIGKERL